MAEMQHSPRGCGRKLLISVVAALGILLTGPAAGIAGPHPVKAVVLRHWPPQYQTDDFGAPTGFAVDVLEHVAASVDIDVSYMVVDSWEEMFDAIRKGDADLIPNQGITAERKNWFAFTSPVETFQVVIFTRKTTSDISEAAHLGGRVIATVQYNIGTRLMNQRRDIEHRVFKNLREAFWELLAGQVDALIYPQPVLMKLAMEAGLEDHIKVVGAPLVEIKRAISVHKDNYELLKQMEPGVKNFVLSRKYEQIYSKWYGKPKPFWTPKRIIWSMTGLIFMITFWHAFRVTHVNRRLRLNIVSRKKAENALRASEEKYRLIVENQSDLTIKLDGAGSIRFASPSFCDAFGMSGKEHIDRPYLALVHQDDRAKVKLAMQSLQVAPHACSHEGRALTPTGWRWFSWSNKAILDDQGNVHEIIAVGRDTTERKRAEFKLQESEEKFRAIFEQAADAVVLLNNKTISVADFNTAAHQALGYTRDEFVRTKLESMVVPGPLGSTSKILGQIMDSREKPVEVPLRTKSGKVRHFLMKQRPLAVNGGKYLLGIWHDITDRKKLEEHLVHSQKMEAIGTLAGGVAHDFNNILSIIIGNTELAATEIAGDHPVGKKLQAIQIAGMRAKEVVRQLLCFSRREQENRGPVQLLPIVEESLQLLRASIPATIEIRKHIHSEELPLLADATQIHQILINLCTNAAQAMEPKGGAIDVTLLSTVLDDRNASRHGIKPGAYAQILVKDTGSGIRPDIIDKIFDPYFTTKCAHQGTGMGLSIVHGIATRHHGAVDVTSRMGLGTTFKVLLPLAEHAQPPNDQAEEAVSKGNERILLIDDEPSIAELGREYLKKLGYHARAHSNAIEALDRFKADPSQFDLVITDMTMPELTGEALASEVLKLRPDMPVILCSGYHSKLKTPSVRSKGINVFLQKPYNMKTLAAAIRKALTENVGNHIFR